MSLDLTGAIASPPAAPAAEAHESEARSEAQVEVYGIRHHGPGSARSLVAALEHYRPDMVLIEGPADADPLLGWSVAEGMEPPLALLAYAVGEPSVAAFWPYAVFSPEWQALTWALRHQIAVAFCDLPAAMTLARSGRRESAESRARRPERIDPLATLAAAAGYDDAERWWDDVVESRMDGASPFPALTEAMAALREDVNPADDHHEMLREAWMRQVLRRTVKSGHERVAVVCGAWHAPALAGPLPPAVADSRVLRGLAKRKVSLTWVPWTHSRLASASGYGAGITSPGWYHHLWTAPHQPVVRWLTKVATSLRSKDLLVSSAHVIEAVRLADTLATLRNRPLAGLSEVTDATRAVLCEGDEVAVRFVTEELVVGQALGAVNDEVPTVPLEADLTARCRTLRIRREGFPRVHDLDLRKPYDQERSKLFHRLRLLELDWIRPAESGVQGRGTFRETWQSQWRPEFAVALVVASVWGTTVEAAASAKVTQVAEGGTLAELTATVERCLLAELPEVLGRLLTALSARAAVDADVRHLMDALPALARARRYGDVRGTDTSALDTVCAAMVLRICSALPQVVSGLDEAEATELRRGIDAVNAAIGLLSDVTSAELHRRWLEVLATLIDRVDVNGQLVGRFVRLLFDAELLTDVADRVHRALSYGVPAGAKAAWVDGFFADGALLLIHDAVLRGLLDTWVSGLDEQEFVDVLPLVRRTFGTFTPSERRAIAGRVAAADRTLLDNAGPGLDLERAQPAVATIALIVGAASGGWGGLSTGSGGVA